MSSGEKCKYSNEFSVFFFFGILPSIQVLNAMMYVRGNRNDYDRWASSGNPGWNYDSVLPYFKKSENMRDPELAKSPFHSSAGYLSVEPFRSISALADITFAAAHEMGLINIDNDVNGATQSGFTQTQGTIRNGLRCSTNKAFLRPARDRPNLHISLNSFVERVLIDADTKETRGVRFLRDGMVFEVLANRETILSAGAVQSPQILMLAGVGPAGHLADTGVDVIVDAPGVGENLQDHISMGGVVYLLHNPISADTLSYIVPKLVGSMQPLREFVFDHAGPLYGMGAAEVMAYVSSKYQDPSVDWPDLQIFFASYSDISDGGLFSRRGSGVSFEYYAQVYERALYRDGIMVIPLLMRPESRGWIRLTNNDPYTYPTIHANYFDHPRDLEVLVMVLFDFSM